MGSILLWWFVVLVAGFAAFPITFIVLKNLPDKGYFFSKILALMMMGYLTWMLGYAAFNGGTILIAFLILVGFSGLILWNWTGGFFFEFVKKNLLSFVLVEGLFLLAFLVAGAYKMRTHDIAGTEKPMDFAFINGILSSSSMPPNDPWLSGTSISYYYFGYLIVAVLCKVTQVSSGEGFNLAVALVWALAAMGGFSLGYALTRRYRYSLFSALCLAVFGNMDYWHRAVQSFQIGDLQAPYYNHAANPNVPAGLTGLFNFLLSPLDHNWDYFQASRIIPVPPSDKMINEFPAFSFFLSDLHPHVMAIPFVLLAMAMAFNLLKSFSPGLSVFSGTKLWQWLQWGLLMMVFGGLFFMNSWDYPTLMLLLGLCLFLQQWWSNEPFLGTWFKAVALVGIPIVLGSFALYLPFYQKFQSQAQGFGLGDDRTDIYYLWVIFGLFLVLMIPAILEKVSQSARGERASRSKGKKSEEPQCSVCGKGGAGKKFCGFCGGDLVPAAPSDVLPMPDDSTRALFAKTTGWIFPGSGSMRGWWILGGMVLILLAANLPSIKLSTLLLAGTMVFLCLLSFAARLETKEMLFSTLLVMIAFLLIAGCEVVFLRDLFAGSLYRMNTVFKFHYQAWILFSVASGPFLKWLLENAWPGWATWKKSLWLGLAVFVFLGAFLYPVLAFTSRMRGSAADMVTMDGAVFYEHVFPTDYQAVQWIKANIKPLGGKIPVILEAWGGSYHQEYARLATNTGYPTVLGWDFHEVQWRGSGDKPVVRGQNSDDTIMHRQADIDAIYTSPDLNQSHDLLRKYGVDYVYVGDIERQKYKDHQENLGKFSQLGFAVQSFGNSILYKVNQ